MTGLLAVTGLPAPGLGIIPFEAAVPVFPLDSDAETATISGEGVARVGQAR